MARSKYGSPRLELEVTPELYDQAVQSNSGGCLIADAIKAQYPQYTSVLVDMATIRFTDKEAGVRYTYLTPPTAQHVLLSFDQGWPNPVNQLKIQRAVKIDPITRRPYDLEKVAENRAERLAFYEEKVVSGEELTKAEKAAFTKLTNTSPPKERPKSVPSAEVSEKGSTVYGGKRLVLGPAHPNLLRGRNRHFGAKLADPGKAFNEAVEAAVAQRLTEIQDQ